ncbi:MAG TPA: FAD-dependent oxidoreductase [Flavobacterium sp.]|jgi:glycine/D-amino acid oxidase-like deaminating enzyme/nitrite reductase/ring-hydroxylating ferredoxin subunit
MENGSLHNETKSIWRTFSSETSFPPLTAETTADVAIIGGGITGITTACLLKDAGFNVVVLEAMKVGAANTGHSTGNLYVAVEEGFDTIQSKYDTKKLQTVIAARTESINLIEQLISKFSIDCDFRRQNWYSFSANQENKPKIEKIQSAGRDAGLNIVDVFPGELPLPFIKGIKISNQAQFNPLLYVQQLASAIQGDNCRIYENSRVTSIKEEEEIITVETEHASVSARYVIHATHTPKGIMLDFHSLLGTYREYGVAATLLSGDYPEGTLWGYYNINDRYSIRTYEHEGEKRIIAVGQPHEVGQKEDNVENIQNVENFLRQHFDVGEITNRWGGQNYKPADGLPYIGRKERGSNIFVATGFSTDGLVYGTLSAIIIRDIMKDIANDYTVLFDAARHNPFKAAGKFIKENAINAYEILKDYVLPYEESKLEEIPRGEGRVIEIDGKKLAVSCREDGSLKACSAICTHMGCVVHWNKAEKTWDCPCHASRFNTDGGIIEGPALTPLQKVDISENSNK